MTSWDGISAEQHDLLDHTGLEGVGGGGSLDSRMIILVANNLLVADLTQETERAVVIGGYLWAPYCPMADEAYVTVQAIATHTTGHINYCQITIRKVADEDGVPVTGTPDVYYGYYQAPPLTLVECAPMVPAALDLAYEAAPDPNYEIHELAPGLHVIRVLSAGVYNINALPTWSD